MYLELETTGPNATRFEGELGVRHKQSTTGLRTTAVQFNGLASARERFHAGFLVVRPLYPESCGAVILFDFHYCDLNVAYRQLRRSAASTTTTSTPVYRMVDSEAPRVCFSVLSKSIELIAAYGSAKDSELPGYAPRGSSVRLVEHIRTTQNSTGVVVTIRSYAKTPESKPVFFSNRPISGSVTLDLKKKSSAVRKVTITTKGYIRGTRRTSQGDDTFLQVSTVLWPKEADLAQGVKKLAPNVHSWAFSQMLPQTTSLICQDGTEAALPPSFSHAGSLQYILYELALLVETGAFSLNYG